MAKSGVGVEKVKGWKRFEQQVYFISATLGGWMLIGLLGVKVTILYRILPLSVLGYYRGTK